MRKSRAPACACPQEDLVLELDCRKMDPTVSRASGVEHDVVGQGSSFLLDHRRFGRLGGLLAVSLPPVSPPRITTGCFTPTVSAIATSAGGDGPCIAMVRRPSTSYGPSAHLTVSCYWATADTRRSGSPTRLTRC
jgi:hypothetical protein